MARRKSNLDPSLFPFMSVLCALIGVLQLSIVAILSTPAVEVGKRYAASETPRPPQAGAPDANEKGIDEMTYEELEADLILQR